jgi:hypothetical protein
MSLTAPPALSAGPAIIDHENASKGKSPTDKYATV